MQLVVARSTPSYSTRMVLPVSLRTVGLLAAGLVAPLLLTQCKSTKKPKYEKIDYASTKLATPPHNMARHDYPFDARGNYRRDWVKPGSSSGASSSRSSSSYSSSASHTPAPAPKPKPKPSARYHTVKKGDTLFSLSKRYGTSVSRLKSVNGLGSDLIRIGQTLRIP